MNLNKIETQAFVQRMFSHYLQTGMSSQDAINTLSQKLGQPYQQAINTLDSAEVIGYESNSNLATASFSNSLLNDANELGGSTEHLATNTHNALRKIAPGVKACARFFSAIFAYPLIIMVIALIVYAMYKTFVLPQMAIAYHAGAMPELTRLVFSDLAAVIILIVAVSIVVFTSLQILELLKSFSKIKPTHSILGRLTGISEHHSYLVFLAYLKVILESKTSASGVNLVEKANSYSSMASFNSYYYRHHRAAITLLSEGSNEELLKEVEFQISDSMSCLEQAFISRQEKLLFIFQIFIFVFVGNMIIAMYLPLFKLASIF